MIRFLLSNKYIRNIICFLRAFYFIKIKKKLVKYSKNSKYIWENTLESNLRHVYDEKLLPAHPKKLKNLLGVNLKFSGENIDYLYALLEDDFTDILNKKILVVGPRNESEILNLFGKGFNLKNIDAIDLFSYSPLVKLGDAHTYETSKNKYDIIFLGWVLAYSNNKELMIKNLKMLLKENGILLVGYSANNIDDKEVLNKRGYLISSPTNRIRNEKDLNDFFLYNSLSIIKQNLISKKDTNIKVAFKLKKA